MMVAGALAQARKVNANHVPALFGDGRAIGRRPMSSAPTGTWAVSTQGAKMKSMIVALAAAAALMSAGMASAQEDLAKASGCMNCHAVDTKKIGPSFKDVAAKYKGKADAEATLTAKISDAKGHPQTKAKPDDVGKLVKWVLSM